MEGIFDNPKSDLTTCDSSYQPPSFYRTPKRSRSGGETSDTSPLGTHKGLPDILEKRPRMTLQSQADNSLQSQSQTSRSFFSLLQSSKSPVCQSQTSQSDFSQSQSSKPPRRSSHSSQSQSRKSTPEQLTETISFEPVAEASKSSVKEKANLIQ